MIEERMAQSVSERAMRDALVEYNERDVRAILAHNKPSPPKRTFGPSWAYNQGSKMRRELMTALLLAAMPRDVILPEEKSIDYTLHKPPGWDDGDNYIRGPIRRAYMGSLPYTPTTEQQRSDAIHESRNRRRQNFLKRVL